MAIRWNLDATFRKHDITNRHQLAERVGIGYPAADRVFKKLETNGKLGRFDFQTLETIARALGVKDPLTLLKHSPD